MHGLSHGSWGVVQRIASCTFKFSPVGRCPSSFDERPEDGRMHEVHMTNVQFFVQYQAAYPQRCPCARCPRHSAQCSSSSASSAPRLRRCLLPGLLSDSSTRFRLPSLGPDGTAVASTACPPDAPHSPSLRSSATVKGTPAPMPTPQAARLRK